MKRIGRPPTPVPQAKADAIIEWISAGQTLREWCRQPGNVSFRTVYDWIEKDADFAARFARAREVGQDVIAEEALAIIDTPPEMAGTTSDKGESFHRDGAHVSWLKNRAEMRLKLLAKWNPKRYGDKVDVTSDGKAVGLAIAIDLSDKAKPEAA